VWGAIHLSAGLLANHLCSEFLLSIKQFSRVHLAEECIMRVTCRHGCLEGVYGRRKREATAGVTDVRVGERGMGQAWWAVYHGSEGQVTADRNG
jgi:hypothetical protein